MFANRLFASAVGLILILAAAPPSFQADVAVATKILDAQASRQLPPQREHFPHADVLHDWVINDRVENLRTFISRPKNVSGKVPAIFFVGWLSCDTMKRGLSNGGGFALLAARDHPVRGYISASSWGRSWYEHMLELERRRLIAEKSHLPRSTAT